MPPRTRTLPHPPHHSGLTTTPPPLLGALTPAPQGCEPECGPIRWTSRRARALEAFRTTPMGRTRHTGTPSVARARPTVRSRTTDLTETRLATAQRPSRPPFLRPCALPDSHRACWHCRPEAARVSKLGAHWCRSLRSPGHPSSLAAPFTTRTRQAGAVGSTRRARFRVRRGVHASTPRNGTPARPPPQRPS